MTRNELNTRLGCAFFPAHRLLGLNRPKVSRMRQAKGTAHCCQSHMRSDASARFSRVSGGGARLTGGAPKH